MKIYLLQITNIYRNINKKSEGLFGVFDSNDKAVDAAEANGYEPYNDMLNQDSYYEIIESELNVFEETIYN